MEVDLQDLAFDQGGALLVKRALRQAEEGEAVRVTGRSPEWPVHLRAWCRMEGHRFSLADSGEFASVVKGASAGQRWADATRAGLPTQLANRADQRWGLAMRGALVESGGPEFHFTLVEKTGIWPPDAARLYAQAAAAQWDPATAIPWNANFTLPDEVEDAVVQVMTYLVENETAALIVPSRFVAQVHPHFREVLQVLAIQAADEARHIEVFTRRALLKRASPALSTAGGQESLKTLIDEPDFAVASFLLSVLGEGTFLALLWFLERHAPDPITAAVCRLAAQDEARHVAFGMSHLREHLQADPGLAGVLMAAVRQRHEALRHTAGLNAEVFDALLLIAAGSWEPGDLAAGHAAVLSLIENMDAARRKRLVQLGFNEEDAREMSSLHTRNFM
jgi:hypothetical protein